MNFFEALPMFAPVSKVIAVRLNNLMEGRFMDQGLAAIIGAAVGGITGVVSGFVASVYTARANRRQFMLQQRRQDYHQFLFQVGYFISKESLDAERLHDCFSRLDILAYPENRELIDRFRQILEEFCSTRSDARRNELRSAVKQSFAEVKNALALEVQSSS